MHTFRNLWLVDDTFYIIYERVVAIGDLDFLNEENLILQDQLDHMAKIDPNGLEALRNGIEEALTKNTYSRNTRLVKNILLLYYLESIKSLVFLLISKLTNGLHLHQFLGTKTTEANKTLKIDANGAH